MGARRGLKRRMRRHRRWWPLWLSLGGALIIAALAALRADPIDRGILGPVIAAGIIAGIAGLVTGVAEGLLQPPAPVALRIRLGPVVLALIVAAVVNAGPWEGFLAALGGAAAGLGLHWSTERAMRGLIGRDEDAED
ncbi:MAG: hypothetical protein ACRDJB_02370 [Actinomycetota bacterium]